MANFQVSVLMLLTTHGSCLSTTFPTQAFEIQPFSKANFFFWKVSPSPSGGLDLHPFWAHLSTPLLSDNLTQAPAETSVLSLPYVCTFGPQVVPTLCDPMDCGTLGLPVPHHLPEFAQVHVH